MRLFALVYAVVGWMPILVMAASPYPGGLIGAVMLVFVYWVAVETLKN